MSVDFTSKVCSNQYLHSLRFSDKEAVDWWRFILQPIFELARQLVFLALRNQALNLLFLRGIKIQIGKFCFIETNFET